MPAIAIALLWASYTGGLWGYCLIRGYNVTLKQLLSPQWPPQAASGGKLDVGGIARGAINGAHQLNPPSGGGKESVR